MMIIHEQQVRQHCAIHAVNNLLQLPSTLVYDQEVVEEQQAATKGDVDGDDASHDEEIEAVANNNNDSETSIHHEWTCHGKIITHQRQWYTATQDEFDNIAIELTIREQNLLYSLLGDDDNKIPGISSNEEMTNDKNDDSTKHKLSFLQRVRSQYGTPYLGNYSIEVITEALHRRGVTLEYYRVPPTEEYDNTNTNNDYFTLASASASSNNTATLIGFVVYTKVDMSQRSISSSLTMFTRHIPIVKNFCNIGHHWYAITGIRYVDCMIPRSDDECSLNDDMNTNNSDDTTIIWNCIDSKVSNVIPFHTDMELMKYMRNVQQCEGGLIFRANCLNS